MTETEEQLGHFRSAVSWPPSETWGLDTPEQIFLAKALSPYSSKAQAPMLITQIKHIRTVVDLTALLSVDEICRAILK